MNFQDFLEEREQILEEIKQFVTMIMNYISDMVTMFRPKFVVTETARSLMESLCHIHGLYGYPDPNSSEGVNKLAVREIVLNEISVGGKTFADFCVKARRDDFWQLREFGQLREPAHIFLQLVRDLFDDLGEAGKVGKRYLEYLPDVNYLKPTVWAQHKERSECFGVSLGVRRFVRPLYLYIKLRQLRRYVEDSHDGVDLSDVIAKESQLDKKRLIKSNASSDLRTRWEKTKEPCDSCQVFFWSYPRRSPRNLKPSFPPFGNCAEYDIIRTNNLDYILRYIPGRPNHWGEFESACQQHFTAFSELTTSLEAGNAIETAMRRYHARTLHAKILKYKMYSTRRQEDVRQFRLIAHNW